MKRKEKRKGNRAKEKREEEQPRVNTEGAEKG
jgi:hypothetical protein